MAISTLLWNECSFATLLKSLTEQAGDNETWRATSYILLELLVLSIFLRLYIDS